MPQYACVLHTFCDLLHKDARIRSCDPRVKLRGNSTSLSLSLSSFPLHACISSLCPFSPYPSIHLLFLLSLSSLLLSLPFFLSLLPRTTDIAIRVSLLLSVFLFLFRPLFRFMHGLALYPPFLDTALPGLLNAMRKARSTARRSFGLCAEARPGSVHLRALCALR
jgi:hypothetical protein